MKAKTYLSEIHLQRNRCRILEEQAEQLRSQIEGVKGITYDKDKVQTSVTNAVEDQLAKLIDIERKFTKELVKFNAMFLHREQQIAKMGKPEYVRILQLRYLETDHGHVCPRTVLGLAQQRRARMYGPGPGAPVSVQRTRVSITQTCARAAPWGRQDLVRHWSQRQQ